MGIANVFYGILIVIFLAFIISWFTGISLDEIKLDGIKTKIENIKISSKEIVVTKTHDGEINYLKNDGVARIWECDSACSSKYGDYYNSKDSFLDESNNLVCTCKKYV